MQKGRNMAGATSKTLEVEGPGLSEDLSSVDNLNLGYFLPYLLNRATHTVNRLISERLSAI